MLKRRIPMSRSRGSQSVQDREVRLQQRAQRQLESAKATAHLRANASMSVPNPALGMPVHKEDVQTSEAYRRAVAGLRCIWCGIQGYSQHAHLNQGKGMGLKTDDRTGFPLCCARPGIEGCHVAYDQYRLVEGGRDGHRAYGKEWGRITRAEIQNLGLWPTKLPLWQETTLE
ncbi:MAG: hypothetical protein LBJ15_16405 [Comamonas sp.]|jgi:hypothetical protein|uniref:hypothetical protein n=1 Tax=Comamonas sp. TaxID=34028 RepID=UPI002816DE4D|nr:hypothetical protein [Comamonas sp.]MDR0215565.1 hypothetical protein [Comamonas sp.]